MTENTETNQDSFNFTLNSGSLGANTSLFDSFDSANTAKPKEGEEAKPAEEDSNFQNIDDIDKEYYKSFKAPKEEETKKPKEAEEVQGEKPVLNQEHETFKTLLKDVYDFDAPEDLTLNEDNFKEFAKESMLGELKKDLGQEGLEVIEHLRNGGSLQDFFEIAQLDDLTTATLEDNVFNQKYVLKAFLTKSTAWNEAKIDSYINKLSEEDLLEESSESQVEWGKMQEHEKRTATEKAASERQKNIKMVEDIKNLIKTSIKDKTTFRDANLNLTPKEKQTLTDYMLKPTVKLSNGKMVSQNEVDYMEEVENMRSAKDVDVAIIQAYQRMKKNYSLNKVTKEEAAKQSQTIAQKLRDITQGRIAGNRTDEIEKEPTKAEFSFIRK